MNINRQAVVVKVKQPFVDWINSTPLKPGNEKPAYTLEQVNADCLVLLIPEFDSNEEARKQVRHIKMDIFEESLEAWYTEEDHWPKDRNEKMFDEWFELEIHSDLIIYCSQTQMNIEGELKKPLATPFPLSNPQAKPLCLRRLLQFFIVMGPGFIVMQADTEAGIITTAAVAGV